MDDEEDTTQNLEMELKELQLEDATSPAPTYTINDVIEHSGFGRVQIFLLLFTGAAWMADSMEVFIISFVIPTLAAEFDLDQVTQMPFLISASFLVRISFSKLTKKGFFHRSFHMGTVK